MLCIRTVSRDHGCPRLPDAAAALGVSGTATPRLEDFSVWCDDPTRRKKSRGSPLAAAPMPTLQEALESRLGRHPSEATAANDKELLPLITAELSSGVTSRRHDAGLGLPAPLYFELAEELREEIQKQRGELARLQQRLRHAEAEVAERDLRIEEVQDVVLRLGDWLNTLADNSELPILIWKLCDSPMLYDQLFPSDVSNGPPTIIGESEDCWP